MMSLTHMQAQCLDFIERFQKEQQGVSPSFEEIKQELPVRRRFDRRSVGRASAPWRGPPGGMSSRRAKALACVCPACGAAAGRPCIGRRGVRQAYHQERLSKGSVMGGRKSPPTAMNNQYKVRIANMIQEEAEAEMVRFHEEWESLRERCESPIEEMLMAALFVRGRNSEHRVDFMLTSNPPAEPYFHECAFVYQQVTIGNYRVDFLILDATLPREIGPHRWMIVECDGHDFHERTKEQARHDKKRDRFFQSMGYKVLRFTGSEIWADPEDCADEIVDELRANDGYRSRHK